MTRLIDLTGQKFNRLTVLGRDTSRVSGHVYWNCQCECGNTKSVSGCNLKRDMVTSCGCKSNDREARGSAICKAKRHPLCRIWQGMKGRCLNKNHPKFHLYGGAGIKVCERWMSFDLFCEDVGERPDGTTLDRKEGSGDYCKDNCRWADSKTQNRNRSWNRNIEAYGLSRPVSFWAEVAQIPATTIISRLNTGWESKKAIFTPPMKMNKKSRVV